MKVVLHIRQKRIEGGRKLGKRGLIFTDVISNALRIQDTKVVEADIIVWRTDRDEEMCKLRVEICVEMSKTDGQMIKLFYLARKKTKTLNSATTSKNKQIQTNQEELLQTLNVPEKPLHQT